MSEPYDDLILKSLNGTLTVEEQNTLDQWIRQSPENRQQMESFKAIWKATKPDDVPDFNTTDEWRRLREKAVTERSVPAPVKQRSMWSPIFKMAAAAAILILASVAIRYFSMNQQKGEGFFAVEAKGVIKTVSLPDGSKVTLNKTGALFYGKDFNLKERSIAFTGEAFFDVAKNSEKKFIIHTTNTSIEVVGTSFTVREALEGSTSVYVLTGKVKVSDDKANTITLVPGETGNYNLADHSLTKDSTLDANALAWRDKKLTFKATRLRKVVASIEQYFDVQVKLEGEKLGECRFTSISIILHSKKLLRRSVYHSILNSNRQEQINTPSRVKDVNRGEKTVDDSIVSCCRFILLPGKRRKRVTLMLTDISLEKALTVLSISYDVTFSYSDDIVPSERIVSLSVQNEQLDAALDKLLAPLAIEYKISKHRIILRQARNKPVQTIRGTVKDEVTGTPIPGVSVMLEGSTPLMGSMSDENGKFRIDNVPVGRVTLTSSSVGFDSFKRPDILLTTGKEFVIDIRLQEAITSMEEVVVVARRNDGIPGNGMAVTSGRSFNVEDTKRYAGSLGDPARMATAFAGVTGASDECNSLIVRGNSPRGVLWRVEGIEIPNPNHFTTEGASSGVIGILSPNMIETSDFLTGAFPAQYGNALSAVFDIHLRNGNNQKRSTPFRLVCWG